MELKISKSNTGTGAIWFLTSNNLMQDGIIRTPWTIAHLQFCNDMKGPHIWIRWIANPGGSKPQSYLLIHARKSPWTHIAAARFAKKQIERFFTQTSPPTKAGFYSMNDPQKGASL